MLCRFEPPPPSLLYSAPITTCDFTSLTFFPFLFLLRISPSLIPLWTLSLSLSLFSLSLHSTKNCVSSSLLLLLLLPYFIDFVIEKSNFSFLQSLRRRLKLLLNCVIIIHRNERVSEWCVNTLTTSSCEHTSIWFYSIPFLMTIAQVIAHAEPGNNAQQPWNKTKQNKTKQKTSFSVAAFQRLFFLSLSFFFTWNLKRKN